MIARQRSEQLLNQKSSVIWLCGLSGSGKSTIATELQLKLYNKGYIVRVLDGDQFRSGLSKDLGFSEEDRLTQVQRAAHVAKLFVESGIIVICCFITPTKEGQESIRSILGPDLSLVYIDTPIEECQNRDPKGLYKQVAQGKIQNFTGIHQPFTVPESDIIISTRGSIDESVSSLLDQLKIDA